MPSGFTESVVEQAALAWLESLGYAVLHGPDIAVGGTAPERSDPNYRDVILEGRLRQALARLNPDLPAEALEDAFRKLTRADAPSLIKRNRALHRMLVDGVTVEYRRADGSIAGAQARVIDFDTPDNNDWLAVNQFTVAEGQHNAPAGRRAVRQRPAARRHRAEEPGRRERDGLERLPAAPNLSGADPGAVRHQRGADRLRRRAGAHRRARRGQGMVQAVAHDHRARGCCGRPRRIAGRARRRVREAPVPRSPPPLHRVRGSRAAARSPRRWRATTSSTRSTSPSRKPCARRARSRLAGRGGGRDLRRRATARRRARRPAGRRRLAHAGLGQEPDDGVLRRAA